MSNVIIKPQTMSSLEIAELTGKEHRNVLSDIRKILKEMPELTADISAVKRKAENGQEYEYFQLSRRGTDILVSGYVLKYRVKIIDRWHYLEKAFANPPRTDLIHTKRKSHWDMTESLKEFREDMGKDTKAHHYMTENKLCNWCIRGEFKALDESTMNNEELELLRLARIQNAAYLKCEMNYKERKVLLKAYVERKRNVLRIDSGQYLSSPLTPRRKQNKIKS